MRNKKKSMAKALGILLAMLSMPISALEDPTRPVLREPTSNTTSVTRTPVKQMRLQAVYVRSEGNRAMINDKVLVQGESTQGYRVVKIDSDRVVIEGSAGVTRELKLTANIKERP